MRYSALLLDFDHTLFDSDASEAIAFNHALLSVGIVEPDRYRAPYNLINKDLWAAVERGEMSPQQVRTRRFEKLVLGFNLDACPLIMADLFARGLGDNGELYPGAQIVLQQLSESTSLALVTNGLSEVQRARLSRLEISQYFDAVVISAEVGVAKPHSEIFDRTFAKLGCPSKDDVMIVGDSLSSDIKGGLNYGIATCWYNPDRKAFSLPEEITHEITQLDELLRLV